MDDRLLVEALQSRDPNAIGALYDSYSAQLYGYCWFQLRGRDAAQVALRDTLIVAEAHIDRLRDPDRFGAWLYAIARLECARRLPLRSQKPDIPIASHDQPDVDQRLMAWRALAGLTPLSRELLELSGRGRLAAPDLAVVVGLSAKNLAEALDQAHSELETALTAEVLAHESPYDCDGRAAILSGRRGELTADVRRRLLLHTRGCEVCGAYQPRAVSLGKMYGLLPTALPSETFRSRVMSCFTDPELAGYRLLVAGRTGDFAPNGFPRQPRGQLPVRGGGAPGRRRRTRTVLAVVALIALGLLASLLGWLVSGHFRDVRTVASQLRPSATALPGVLTPRPAPRRIRQGSVDVTGSRVSETFPLGVRQLSSPAGLPQSPPIHIPQLGPGWPDPPDEPGAPGVSPSPAPGIPTPSPPTPSPPTPSPPTPSPPSPAPPTTSPAPSTPDQPPRIRPATPSESSS
jgi:DNA-directed RNA polymerase specialized sigma24 family protein